MAKKIVTQWNGIVEASERGENIWVGVDVHKASYSAAVLSESCVRHNFTTTSDNQAFIRQFLDRGIKITALVYEAGPTGFNLYRVCQENSINAMVVAAIKIPRPAAASAKTDRLDCLKLVELLSKGMLTPIAVPSREQEAARALVRRRKRIATEIGQIKVRIRSFLAFHGLPEISGLSAWSQNGLQRLESLDLPAGLRDGLDSYIRQFKFLKEEMAVLQKKIKVLVLPDDDVLQTIAGVGPIVSATFRTELFDPERFSDGEKVTGFIGLAPTIRQSGESRGQARLLRSGQEILRAMLVEAAWLLKGKQQWAKDYYNRLLNRKGVAQKAIVALARKLAVIMWRVWLENRPYRSDYSQPVEFEA